MEVVMLAVAQTLGSYEITGILGEGGFAVVYEGIHKTLGHKVAIKVLHDELGVNPAIRERFRREAMLLANMDHSGIVRAIDFIEEEGICAFVLEYLEGQALDDILLRRPDRWSAEVGLKVIIDVLETVQYAHARPEPVVHRDLKPSNIFIKSTGRGPEVRVMDFGVARILGQGQKMTRTGTVIGTLQYMAPEQIEGRSSVDHRADIYAMGIVLYEIVTGRVPFDEDSDFKIMKGHMELPPPPPRQFNGEVSMGLEAVILKALAKNPADRFQSAEGFREALMKTKEAQTPEQEPVVAQPQAAVLLEKPRSTPRVPTVVESTSTPAFVGDSGPTTFGDERPPKRATTHKDRGAPWSKLGGVGWGMLAVGGLLLSGLLVVALVLNQMNSTDRPSEPASDQADRSSASTSPQDRVEIPGGSFFMGCSPNVVKGCKPNTDPGHRVDVGAFKIDRTEVTNGAFSRCVADGGCQRAGADLCAVVPLIKDRPQEILVGDLPPSFTLASGPVVCVTWEQARAYCSWVGGRLPTEAEWEKAARGDDQRLYPWGDEPPSCELASMRGENGSGGCGHRGPGRVGRYKEGKSPYGVLDMAGSVWEWTADWYAKDYYWTTPARDPSGPSTGFQRVRRGGGFMATARWGLLYALTRHEAEPSLRDMALGFRCAYDVGP